MLSGQPSRATGASPAAGSWDVANNCVSDGRAGRWTALRWLWRAGALERVRACRRFSNGDGLVGVVRREEHAHFAGLQTCGSVWVCPICSERIMGERANELAAALGAHHDRGGSVAMVTLTMRHDRGQALAELWDALSQAWRAASGGGAATRKALAGAGAQGWTRRVEVTHGEHGWHVHVHALVFFADGVSDARARALGVAMFGAWAKRLTSLGLAAPVMNSGGLDVRRLDLTAAVAELAGYVTKQRYEAVEGVEGPNGLAHDQDAARAAAREVAGGAGKRGRWGNRTPMHLLADTIAYGLAEDFALWREWEQASKGRRALTWSRGWRAQLVPDEERTDEELAAESDGGGEVVAFYTPRAWETLRVRAEELLRLVEAVPATAAFDALSAWASSEGLPPPLRPPPE